MVEIMIATNKKRDAESERLKTVMVVAHRGMWIWILRKVRCSPTDLRLPNQFSFSYLSTGHIF